MSLNVDYLPMPETRFRFDVDDFLMQDNAGWRRSPSPNPLSLPIAQFGGEAVSALVDALVCPSSETFMEPSIPSVSTTEFPSVSSAMVQPQDQFAIAHRRNSLEAGLAPAVSAAQQMHHQPEAKPPAAMFDASNNEYAVAAACTGAACVCGRCRAQLSSLDLVRQLQQVVMLQQQQLQHMQFMTAPNHSGVKRTREIVPCMCTDAFPCAQHAVESAQLASQSAQKRQKLEPNAADPSRHLAILRPPTPLHHQALMQSMNGDVMMPMVVVKQEFDGTSESKRAVANNASMAMHGLTIGPRSALAAAAAAARRASPNPNSDTETSPSSSDAEDSSAASSPAPLPRASVPRTVLPVSNRKAHDSDNDSTASGAADEHEGGDLPFSVTVDSQGRQVCGHCGDAFKTRFSLKRHMKKHLGVKPYPCPFDGCGRSFAEKSTLTRHCRIHTGEKPFICTYSGCGRRFADRTNVKRHERTHRGGAAASDSDDSHDLDEFPKKKSKSRKGSRTLPAAR